MGIEIKERHVIKGILRSHLGSAPKIVLICLAMLIFNGLEVSGAENQNPSSTPAPADSAPAAPEGVQAAPLSPPQTNGVGQGAPAEPNIQVEPPQGQAATGAGPQPSTPGQPPNQVPAAGPAQGAQAPSAEEIAQPGGMGTANTGTGASRPVYGRFGARPIPAAAPGAIAPSRRVSLNFDDADVFSVIQTIFGEIMRVNYVVDPHVKGRVTFRSVSPISTDQVLPIMEVILRINGIGVVEDRDLYRIVPLSEVSREPSPISFGKDPAQIPTTGKSIIQVVPITYLQSTEVVKLITPFLSATAVCLDVPKSNQVIIVDTDASVRRILQLISTFDNETQKKKRASVFVYPVQNGKAKDIATLLQQIFLGTRATAAAAGATTGPPAASSPLTRPDAQAAALLPPPVSPSGPASAAARSGGSLVSEMTRIMADETINSVIVLSTPEDYQTIKEAISRLDILPRQVMIEGVIAQVNLQDNLSLGLAYAFGTHVNVGGGLTGDVGVNADTLAQFNTTNTSTTGGTTTALPASTGFSYIAHDTRGIYRVYLDALTNTSKGKLLAAPHILVSDNHEARIQVGQQVPIITASIISPAGTASGTIATQTIQYKDIGIILKIKPQVNDSGLVTLELSQEVSTYSTIQLGQNETTIILNTTQAATHLVVQDGHTIVIGGLIREDNTIGEVGVPFLNQIPILGYLFGNKNRQGSRQELIILLTPRVIKSPAQARAVTSDYLNSMTSGKGSTLTRSEIESRGVQTKKGLQRDNIDAQGAGTPKPANGEAGGK